MERLTLTRHTLSEFTTKTTICGILEGQGAALALISHYLRETQRTSEAGFDLRQVAFSGLHALGIIRGVCSAHHGHGENPTGLPQALWRCLVLKAEDAPIQLVYYGSDPREQESLAGAIGKIRHRCAEWHYMNDSTAAIHSDHEPTTVSDNFAGAVEEVRIPFEDAQIPQHSTDGSARLFWRTPWRRIYIREIRHDPVGSTDGHARAGAFGPQISESMRSSTAHHALEVAKPPPSVPNAAPRHEPDWPCTLIEHVPTRGLGLMLFDVVLSLCFCAMSVQQDPGATSRSLLSLVLIQNLYQHYPSLNGNEPVPQPPALRMISPHTLIGFDVAAANHVVRMSDDETDGAAHLGYARHKLIQVLADAPSRQEWAELFAQEYIRNGRLRIPGGSSVAVMHEMENVCEGALSWMQSVLLPRLAAILDSSRSRSR